MCTSTGACGALGRSDVLPAKKTKQKHNSHLFLYISLCIRLSIQLNEIPNLPPYMHFAQTCKDMESQSILSCLLQ